MLPLLGVLVVVVGFLFRDSFRSEMALFANDSPLGAVSSDCLRLPAGFWGVWADLNWLGINGGSTPVDLTSVLFLLLGPLSFIKFYPALTVVILGLCAWLFFRKLGFHPAVCVVGGLAAALNSDFFSYACWGLGTLTLCVASVFLAMTALVSKMRWRWAGPVLAGAALGNALLEGFDNGAIFSLYVAAFAVFQSWLGRDAAKPGLRLGSGMLDTAIVAIVSALVAAHVLLGLVSSNIQGVTGMGQDKESTAARWNFATQWSLPPRETIRAIIPGVYGYRMDSPEGGQYWGKVGMDPSWDSYWAQANPDPNSAPRAILRYSGAGHYAGILVVLMAGFALIQSLRREGSGFTVVERKWVWFWGIVTLASLLFAFGRFAPFYRLIYALPYFNTIRNPVKFLHPFNVGLVVLCGYGLQALWRGWVDKPSVRSTGVVESISAWWRQAKPPERQWGTILVGLAAVSVFAWLIYGSGRRGLIEHLGRVGFTGANADVIARHSIREVGMFAVLMVLSAGLVLTALSGWFTGARSRWASVALGGLLALDLARANVPWIIHYNWKERYASNPLFDLLGQAPQEGRVLGNLPFGLPGRAGELQQSLASVYGVEWLQHQFRFFNIQAMDIVQMPRTPADLAAYRQALAPNPVREWELGNVRYLLSLSGIVDPLNQQFDPARRRFKTRSQFSLSQAAHDVIQVQTNESGPFGLIEFGGALPRVMLFEKWRSGVSDEEALQLLPSTNFNPHLEVLVAEQVPAPSVDTSTPPAGSAVFQSYSPKRSLIRTEARTPGVLLLNDKHDPNWKVFVDGKEEPLLRANFIMRGVYLTAGTHQVEFRFEPPQTSLWLSLTSLGVCLGLLGMVCFVGRKDPA
ncbi:MAG: hypothetical protein IT581_00340 [Verrucomicrobiales bacterium]|nr:hypothetical protein [Verrucomicrobiales bacterium]